MNVVEGGLLFDNMQKASKDSAFLPFLSARQSFLLEIDLFTNEPALGERLCSPLVYHRALL